MIDDIIIIQDLHRKKAEFILPALLKLPDKSIIGIQGISGVGKTEIGSLLREGFYKLNKTSLLLSLDDSYITDFRDRERIRKRKGLQSVGIKEIEWKSLRSLLSDFKNGKEVLSIQQISKCAETFIESTIYRANKLNYVLIEGLYTGYLKKYSLLDYCIYLEGNAEDTLSFRKIRMKEKENSKFRQQIVQKEYKVVSQLKKYADIVIPYNLKDRVE